MSTLTSKIIDRVAYEFAHGLMLRIASIASFAHSLLHFIFKKTAINISKSVNSKVNSL
jgi:hypothetical protein|tara:strand:- start:1167 stop:1340 length:174 start_codon:yes stop_codon:yes gene_type:complete